MKYKEFLETIKKYPLSSNEPETVAGGCCSNNSHSHVHEYEGSTHIAEEEEDPHNHRFAGVTGGAIPIGNGRHKHEFRSNTDFFEDHHHIICGFTGPDIQVSPDKHVHFVDSFTTVNDNHRHKLEFATLIGPSPIT